MKIVIRAVVIEENPIMFAVESAMLSRLQCLSLQVVDVDAFAKVGT